MLILDALLIYVYRLYSVKYGHLKRKFNYDVLLICEGFYIIRYEKIFAGSSNGRIAAFEAVSLGSNPSPAAKYLIARLT